MFRNLALVLLLATLPLSAAENVSAFGPVARANISAIGPVAIANVSAIGAVDNTGGGLAVGDIFNEDFRSGYENAGWSEVNNPTDGATLPGSPPSELPANSSLRANVTTSTSYATRDMGAATSSTRYFRWWIYVAAESLGDAETMVTQRAENGSGDRAFQVSLFDDSGQLQIFGTGSSSSTKISISAATWYRVIVKWVNNSTGGNELKVFNTAGSQVGSTVTFDTDTTQFEILYAGIFFNGASKAMDLYTCALGIDSAVELNP